MCQIRISPVLHRGCLFDAFSKTRARVAFFRIFNTSQLVGRVHAHAWSHQKHKSSDKSASSHYRHCRWRRRASEPAKTNLLHFVLTVDPWCYALQVLLKSLQELYLMRSNWKSHASWKSDVITMCLMSHTWRSTTAILSLTQIRHPRICPHPERNSLLRVKHKMRQFPLVIALRMKVWIFLKTQPR